MGHDGGDGGYGGSGYPLDPALSSGNMNEMSALAAAATDQLYELERHEALRRAEYEFRHRQIAGNNVGMGKSKSAGTSPMGTPILGPSFGGGGGGHSGFSNERERWGSLPPAIAAAAGAYGLGGGGSGGSHPSGGPGGNTFYPVSAAQPANHYGPAVPPGTLADPTYLLPPTCHHEECHKSYRKRLKLARATQACPNCLMLTHGGGMIGAQGHGGHGSHGGVGGGGKGGNNNNNSGGGGGGGGNNSGSNHSSNSNTPQSHSHEDLYGLGNSAHAGGSSGHGPMQQSAGPTNASNVNAPTSGMMYQHQAIQQHLQRLAANQAQQKYNQQKLLAQLSQQAQQANSLSAMSSSAPSSLRNSGGMAHLRNIGAHRNPASFLLPSAPASAAQSHSGSAPVSPISDSSDDFEDAPHIGGRLSFDLTPLTSPVLGSMKTMSLFPGAGGHHAHGHGHGPYTAPTSIAASPMGSRSNSRANSPDVDSRGEGGHIAGSSKHHYSARDGNKHRSHPYPNAHGTSTPLGTSSHSRHSGRMSPPPSRAVGRSNSHTHVASMANDSSTWQQHQHASTKPSVEDILNSSSIPPSDRMLPPPKISQFSLTASSNPNSTHASPIHSRSNSPGPGGNSASSSSSNLSHLAHGVRAAFGMTPISQRFRGEDGPISPPLQQRYAQGLTSPPAHLAPLGGAQGSGLLPSFSRGGSPAAQEKNDSAMEVDARV